MRPFQLQITGDDLPKDWAAQTDVLSGWEVAGREQLASGLSSENKESSLPLPVRGPWTIWTNF